MRLERNNDSAVHRPRRCEYRGDLCGMVAVVVDHQHTVRLSANLESTLGALELVQAWSQTFEGHADLDAHGNSREGVEKIVMSRHLKLEPPQRCDRRHSVTAVEALHHGGRDRHGSKCHVESRDIGRLGHAVRDHATCHLSDCTRHVLVICAAHHRAIEGHSVGEVDERLAKIVETAVVLQVLVVDVGNNSYRRKQLQERPIALVGFHDHQLAAPQPRIAAEGA